ncbi:MAG: hypothetical protein ACRCUT_08835, partial [Spirochaetota bacterium]
MKSLYLRGWAVCFAAVLAFSGGFAFIGCGFGSAGSDGSEYNLKLALDDGSLRSVSGGTGDTSSGAA